MLIMEGQGVLAVVRLVEPLHHELVVRHQLLHLDKETPEEMLVRHPRLVKEVLAAMLIQVQQGLAAVAAVLVWQAV